MGRRRAKATKVVKKSSPPCRRSSSAPSATTRSASPRRWTTIKKRARSSAGVCAATYTATINYLSEPVDVFSEWIDQCEAEDEERAKRDAARDRGEDVEEDAPAPKRTRIDFSDPAEDEAEVDPNDDPALHAGL